MKYLVSFCLLLSACGPGGAGGALSENKPTPGTNTPCTQSEYSVRITNLDPLFQGMTGGGIDTDGEFGSLDANPVPALGKEVTAKGCLLENLTVAAIGHGVKFEVYKNGLLFDIKIFPGSGYQRYEYDVGLLNAF